MIEKFLRTHSNRFVSSTIILWVDVLLATLAFTTALLLRFNFDIRVLSTLPLKSYFGAILVCRLLCFLAFRSYQGIVRHTGLEDVWRLLYTVGSATLLCLLGAKAAAHLNQFQFSIPASVLLIDFFCCLFTLVATRFFVKAMYWGLLLPHNSKPVQSVFIYGAGPTGLLTRDTLARDSRYQLLGFIDDNPHKVHKYIQGLKVMTRQQALERFLLTAPQRPEVIITLESPNVQQLEAITDFFLAHQVQIKTVPSLRQWINGKLTPDQIRHIRIEDLLEREPIHLNDHAVQQELTHKRVLITGAAGSIGSELVRQVLSYGPDTLVLVDQAESPLYELVLHLKTTLASQLEHTRLVVAIGDVSDQRRMQQLLSQHLPHFVFHAAAYKHVPLMEEQPYEALRVNVLGTSVLAGLAVRYGVEKFIMISTDKAVNPTNVMGASKRLAEMYVQSLNSKGATRFIATRFGNVLGSNGSVVNVFREQIRMGGPLTVTHPEVIRYFMTISEACQLVLEAGAMGQGGEVFVFDMGKPVRIADLAQKMIRLSGTSGKVEISYTGLRPGEKLYEELLNDNEKTLPTHHPKIMIAKVVAPPLKHMQLALEELEGLLAGGQDLELVSWLKVLIPEYRSQNSVFQQLDSQNNIHLSPQGC